VREDEEQMTNALGGEPIGAMQPVPGAVEADEPKKDRVEVKVHYLPAAKTFEHRYPRSTELATLRTDSMTFFQVKDHKDRDTHEFFLEFEKRRLTNLSETLEQLLGPHRHEAEFHLVEQVTQGVAAA
jgi:hypothetical protein